MDRSSKEQRWNFIELISYWEGGINTPMLEKQFGQSRQQSSSDINQYKELVPDNLYYDASRKIHLATQDFKPRYISDSADDYLFWFHTKQLIAPSIGQHSEILSIPPRKISPAVIRNLVAAIRQQKRVDVDYVSLNAPDYEGRVIAPHSFVKAGNRWHLRAWCEKSQEFRDFVLSRFRGTPDLYKDKTEHTVEKDFAWNTEVTLLLQPDPRLSAEKQAVLESDYQMQNGQLRIISRGCLVQYLLREMQVGTKVLDGTPEAQQLVCVNLPEIKKWLFE
jgi:WYL domain